MKKPALYVLIGAVSLGALLAIIALLSGEFDELHGKMIGTSLTLAGVSVIILACGAAQEKQRGGIYVAAGILSALSSGVLALMGIWGDLTSDVFAELLLSTIVTATYCGHAAMLHTANLLRGHRWVRTATIGCTTVLSGLLLGYVWIDDFHRWVGWRWPAVLAVLGSAGTISALVLARIGRDHYVHPSVEGHTVGAVAVCPHCGGVLPESMKGIFS